MKLTDTQTQILAAAAEQQDRSVKPPAIPPGPRGAIEAKLRAAGLIEQVQLDAGEHPAMAWRRADGEALGYRITEGGLAAVGAAAAAEAGMPPEGATESAERVHPSAGTPPQAGTPPAPLAGLPESNAGLSVAQPRLALRAAAQAVLVAWEDEAGQRAGLPDAVATLRSALAGKPARTLRDPNGPRKPREGTKQQGVLDLLRRPEGATVAQIAEATGWAPHTVRGFLAGLQKKGVTVTVLERVRQVGSGKAGAKGSHSVYRVAEAG